MANDFDGTVGQDSPVPPPHAPVPEPLPPGSGPLPPTPQPLNYPAPTVLPHTDDSRRENPPSWGEITPASPKPPVSPVEPRSEPVEPRSGGTDFAAVEQEPGTIATWPALTPETEKRYPVSARTGEPRRPRILLVAIIACWLSVACTVVAFGAWWWQAVHIPTFTSSARLLTWTHPDPVSALAIVMVILVGLIGLLMVAAAGTVAYNAWAGKRWIRVGALVCVAVTGLSFLLTWWFSSAMIPLAIGAALLWLPPVNRFFTAMDDLQTVPAVQVPTAGILYGPQTLIGHR